jgi:hypothetical protein
METKIIDAIREVLTSGGLDAVEVVTTDPATALRVYREYGMTGIDTRIWVTARFGADGASYRVAGEVVDRQSREAREKLPGPVRARYHLKGKTGYDHYEFINVPYHDGGRLREVLDLVRGLLPPAPLQAGYAARTEEES